MASTGEVVSMGGQTRRGVGAEGVSQRASYVSATEAGANSSGKGWTGGRRENDPLRMFAGRSGIQTACVSPGDTAPSGEQEPALVTRT